MSNVSPVDWLFQKLWDTPKDKFDWHAILEDAKQMEKDQIINLIRFLRTQDKMGKSVEDLYEQYKKQITMAQETFNLQSSGTQIENPFTVTFNWKQNSITVRLKNGEDVLKLAKIFSNMLTENGIENTVETSELKFQ